MVLGAGELAKEFIIAAKRYGAYVIAIDKYEDAPGMQVADVGDLCNMIDGGQLEAIVRKHCPDIIVPEIESICVEKLFQFEEQNIRVIPSANAVEVAMDRLKLRELAVKLGFPCARFRHVTSLKQLDAAYQELGGKVVIKPLMSSSGKGQTIATSKKDLIRAWQNLRKGRGYGKERSAIVEEFIDFDFEITLLTLTQTPFVDDSNEKEEIISPRTLFCPIIGHIQEHGDYRESWQPVENMSQSLQHQAQEMARKITNELGGNSVWGVEFFVKKGKDGSGSVFFSELSPRPHDTGMVTLANTQTFNEFELHARTILNIPTVKIRFHRSAASTAIVAKECEYIENEYQPRHSDYAKTSLIPDSDFRIFGKPDVWVGRRMGFSFAFGSENLNEIRQRSQKVAECLEFRTKTTKFSFQ